jgi:hypothetical protein
MFQKPCTVYLSKELGIFNPIIRRFGFLYKKILIKKTSFTTIKYNINLNKKFIMLLKLTEWLTMYKLLIS